MTTKLRDAPGRLPSGRVAVDPRIRRRRIEIARAEGRRRLRLLVGVTALALLIATGWALSRSPLLDIDHVVVTGAAHTPARDVVAASGLRTGQPMTGIDEGRAAQRAARLPWVASAAVTRQWPGTVEIVVVERIPVASVEVGPGRWAAVDEHAKVLEIGSGRPPELVAVLGLTDVGGAGSALSYRGRQLLSVAREVPADLRDRLAGVAPALAPDEGVDLVLEDGARLRIGAPERLREKFQAALTVLSRVNTTGMESLDVRVPDAPVLTRPSQKG